MKRRLLYGLTALIAGCLLVTGSWAQTIVGPSIELTPEDVVSIQLKALSEAENDPATNSGVARVWAFAHPANRRMTGPLSRFAAMLMTPQYRPLIGHRRHFLKQIKQTVDQAHFAIEITGTDRAVLGYSWQLGKVKTGPYKNMWMTTAVVLVGKLGQSL